MTKAAMVRRISDGVEKTRVVADSIDVRVLSKPEEDPAFEIRDITAEGGVTATGRPILRTPGEGETPTQMEIRARGDLFRYDPAKGRAVLEGHLAEVRIREAEEKWNRISGRRLVFEADVEKALLEKIIVEEEVSATVYLAVEKGGEPRPFTLNADRLEIEPAPPGPEGTETSPEAQIRSIVASGNVTLMAAVSNEAAGAAGWVVSGRRLTFAGGEDRDIHLEGTEEEPARMARTHRIGEREYEDWFRALSMKVKVRGQRLVRFESPTGGDVELHRVSGDEGGIGMPGGGAAAGRVERIVAHGGGRILYDAEKLHLRIDEETRFEQFVDSPDGFRSVAKFRTDLLQAWLEKDEDGVDVLRRAEGRGRVKGEGKDWTLTCDSFEVDLKHGKTTILGKPATVTVKKAKNTVERAEYDYVNDEWEFFRVGGGPR
jgi:hypothetical protein